MEKDDRRAPLPGLTALRFFAATYVLLFHLFPVTPREALHPTLVQRLVGAGFTGVSCFFVLSGFILAYTHPRVTHRGRFYRARFARIYPLYLFALLLALPNFLRYTLAFGVHSQLWAVPADLLLIQAWILPLALSINTPAWTLSCEAFFYLLFPFFIAGRWLRSGRPVLLIALLWILQVAPPLLATLWWMPRHPASALALRTVLFTPLLRLGEFLAGIVLGKMFMRQQDCSQERQVRTPPWLLPASIVFCVAVLLLNYTLPHEVVRNGLMLGPFCVLIWAMAGSRSRLLASRPLQLGGEISYGVYLLQVPLSHWLYAAVRRSPLGFLHHPLWIFVVYPFAWLTYLGVEKPGRDWLLGRRPTRFSKPIPTPQPDLP